MRFEALSSIQNRRLVVKILLVPGRFALVGPFPYDKSSWGMLHDSALGVPTKRRSLRRQHLDLSAPETLTLAKPPIVIIDTLKNPIRHKLLLPFALLCSVRESPYVPLDRPLS